MYKTNLSKICCATTTNKPASASGYAWFVYRRSWAVIESVVSFPPGFVRTHSVIRRGGLAGEMADDKRGRDKQAQDADRRQRERAIEEELERWDDPEPPVESESLADFEEDLDSLSFPTTGAEIVTAAGDHEINAAEETYRVAELVPDTDTETFDTPATVKARVVRPTIAEAMKQIAEACETVPHVQLEGSQPRVYEKTFQRLKAIDPDDDDEGIQVIRDWIVDQIHETQSLPGSRAVRRKAAAFCRENGYEIGNDEWLGI